MPAPEKRPLKVFLCHAHADREPVRALYKRLVKDGVDAWLDKEKLLPGQDWKLEIEKAVREADVVVVCLSNQFKQAGFRQKEVRLALDTAMEKPEGEIFIIPARLEECDSLDSLSKWHWVDLFESNGFQRLMMALHIRADRIGAVLRQRKSRGATVSRPNVTREQAETDEVSREKTEQDVIEKAHLDAEELERQKTTIEQADRESAEKAARDKAEQNAIEKARLEAEKLERQKAAKEKENQDADEKSVRERVERESDKKTVPEISPIFPEEKIVESLKPNINKLVKQEISSSKIETSKTAPRGEVPALKSQATNKKRERLSLNATSPFLLGGVILLIMACLVISGLITIPPIIKSKNATNTAYAAISQSYDTTSTADQANYNATMASYDSESATWTAEALSYNATNTAIFATVAPFTTEAKATATALPIIPTESITPTPTINVAATLTTTSTPPTFNWGETQFAWSGQPISFDNINQLKELAKLQVGTASENIDTSNIEIANDGKLIIYGLGTVLYTLQVDSGNIKAVTQETTRIECVDLSSNGNFLAFVNRSGTKVWNIKDGSLVQTLENNSCPVALSLDGSMLASASYRGIAVYRISDGTLLTDLTDLYSNISKINAFSPDGTLLTTTDYENGQYAGVSVWKVDDLTLMHTFPEGISSAFSPDGSLLATITSDNEVSIWKISDWSLFSALKKDESTYNYGYSFAYFVSNKQIITGDLWNKNKNKIWRFSGDSAYHQDFVGPYTGIISGDNTFFVYMEQTGSKIFIHLWGISP